MGKGGWRRGFRKTRYGFFRNFRKNIFRKLFGRSVLPEETKCFPEEGFFQKTFGISGRSFRKKCSSGIILEEHFFRKVVFFSFFFKTKIIFVFFKWIIIFLLIILFYRFYEKWGLGFWCHVFFIIYIVYFY